MPMAPAQPLFLMHAAVNRTTFSGRVAGPEQRVSREAALRAVTIDAAYALRLEKEVGSIEPGKRASFTVLDANPLTVPDATIRRRSRARCWSSSRSRRAPGMSWLPSRPDGAWIPANPIQAVLSERRTTPHHRPGVPVQAARLVGIRRVGQAVAPQTAPPADGWLRSGGGTGSRAGSVTRRARQSAVVCSGSTSRLFRACVLAIGGETALWPQISRGSRSRPGDRPDADRLLRRHLIVRPLRQQGAARHGCRWRAAAVDRQVRGGGGRKDLADRL
jgi:hypothetical protein